MKKRDKRYKYVKYFYEPDAFFKAVAFTLYIKCRFEPTERGFRVEYNTKKKVIDLS